jgi:hypothetical protein
MNKQYLAIAIVVIGLIVALVVIDSSEPKQYQTLNPIGGIGNETYTSTSTSASNWGTATTRMLKIGNGTLGSVVVTGATIGGTIELRNATSTIDAASTTIAIFTAGATSGNYTFDVAFTRGLSVITATGLTASTTITFR